MFFLLYFSFFFFFFFFLLFIFHNFTLSAALHQTCAGAAILLIGILVYHFIPCSVNFDSCYGYSFILFFSTPGLIVGTYISPSGAFSFGHISRLCVGFGSEVAYEIFGMFVDTVFFLSRCFVL